LLQPLGVLPTGLTVSHPTDGALDGTNPLLPLQANRPATPGWSLAIGISNIGTVHLSNCSTVYRLAW
jgi:hypothetical protein